MMLANDIVKSLNIIADNIYNEPDMGPHLEFIYIINNDNSRYMIKCLWHPFYVRYRAKQLEKTIKDIGIGLSDNAKKLLKYINKPKQSLRRARFSKRIAQRFLDDGETDNYNNYMELFK